MDHIDRPMPPPIYLDNHATTRVDPQVSDAIRAMEESDYANAGSVTHSAGRAVADKVSAALAMIANNLGCEPTELVMTSGATESNNLALFGASLHPRQKRRVVVSVATEHRAVLDPVDRLRSLGFETRWLPVYTGKVSRCGQVDLDAAESLIDDSVAIVSVMQANNEIGVIQPIRELAELCGRHGALLHCDATQAVGHIDVKVDELGVDLMSFSSHKFYGPKGVGGLFVRERGRRVKLHAQIVGGGQQENRRSGTLNSIGIIATAVALERCRTLAPTERPRMKQLRDTFWSKLTERFPEVELNGPALESTMRLDRNLNCRWPNVEGQSLMLACPDLCISSGSACTSAEPRPSHVLAALGLSMEEIRCSTRLGFGRFTTDDEVERAVEMLVDAYQKFAGV